MTARAPWMARAACTAAPVAAGDWEMFPEDRFPAANSAEYRAEVDRLRTEYCGRCPVRIECLDAGMDEEYGVFGGLSAQERRKILTRRCACGAPLDPMNMIGNKPLPYCPNCTPLALRRAW